MTTTTGTISRRKSGWAVNLNIDGRRRQLSAKTKAEAQQRLAAALQGRIDSPASNGGGYLLLDALRDAAEHIWKGQTGEDTALTYARQVVDYLGPSTAVEDVSYEDAEGMIRHFQKQGNQPQTINAKLSKLRIMRDMGVRFGGVKLLPPVPKNLPLNNRQTHVWEPQEIKVVVADLWARGKHEHAQLFLFLCEMGLRFSEAARLKGSHVDLKRGVIEVFKAKADNKSAHRFLRLTPSAWECIQPNVPAIPAHRVWKTTYGQLDFQIRTTMARLGIEKPRPLHTARHTCGSNLGRAGQSNFEIGSWLGHANSSTTDRYVHMNSAAQQGCFDALSAASAGGISNLVNATDS